MTRIAVPSLENAPEASRKLLEGVGQQLGVIPNLYRLIGLTPAGLGGVLALGGALHKTLDVRLRERIAIAVAAVNGCDYCMSAHSYLGLNLAKLDETEIAANRHGHSDDARADAALVFARKVAEARGKVTDADIAAVRQAGFSDAQIVEIVLVIAENFLTNLLNNVAETEIDFPVIRAQAA